MTDIDINGISESLNSKADVDLDNTQPRADYVIDYGQSEDGSQWYRLWKSGWCEQGGTSSNNSRTTTVNLLINYNNTNYTVILIQSNSGTDYTSTVELGVCSKETNGFLWQAYFDTNVLLGAKADWYACGFSA